MNAFVLAPRALASHVLAVLLLAAALAPSGRAQDAARLPAVAPEEDGPSVAALAGAAPGPAPSAFRSVVERYDEDRDVLRRRYDAPFSSARRARLQAFYREWQERLQAADYERLGVEGRIDYHLLAGEVQYQLHELDREERLHAQMAPVMPFADAIVGLYEARREHPEVDARAAAETLVALVDEVGRVREALRSGATDRPSRIVAFRAAGVVDELRETLEDWHGFYDGYHPLFTWWVSAPYDRADAALADYAAFLRHEVAGIPEEGDAPVIGDPIGAEAMAADLAHEMIPYTPEELLAIGEREFAWCEAEMLKAAREMGYGDDWRAALEHVKTLHVAPGEQPTLVQALADEAVAFLEARDLLTIPPLAKEVWRIEMMSPERQKVNPFFTGGEVISVSFPTDGMAHADKLMSMRGNNIHFSRATVHHELIPGHHLQGFMTRRYNPHRSVFSTPFWGEGWALYWEMQFYDWGLAATPEDRVGMLFWRMHRAARILFSLGFHLGEMTPQEAVDVLVDRVGHERANAEAEVRRSFNGSYPPLYQAAYMLGGLQIRALYDDLVASGRMTDGAFHDAILQGGRMPIEMVRARLRGELLPRDFTPGWRFAGDPLR